MVSAKGDPWRRWPENVWRPGRVGEGHGAPRGAAATFDIEHFRMIFRAFARSLAIALALGLGLTGAALAGGVGASPLAGQDAITLLERAAERYRAMDGFCADFRQVVQNDLLRDATRSRGELCQAGTDRFEMRFTEPEGDRVVADGRHVWVYFPSADAGQVFRTQLQATEGRFDLHREFLSEPGERYAPTYQGTEEVDGYATHVLSLEPLRPSPYLRARLWLDADRSLIRKVEIVEDEGFVRVLELSRIRVNPSIPADRFRFDPPAGVQVIVR